MQEQEGCNIMSCHLHSVTLKTKPTVTRFQFVENGSTRKDPSLPSVLRYKE